MSLRTAQDGAETEAVREAFAALNRNDIAAMVKAFDAEIEWSTPLEFPRGGACRGLAAVTAHLAESRASWAEGSCEPERAIASGDKVAVLVSVRARLKDETEWREGKLADVFTFREGKVMAVRTFPDWREGFAWAGVSAEDAG